jgi:hypothetical protein
VNFARALFAVALLAAPAAANNALTEKEKADGGVLLFGGRTLDGWMTSGGKPSRVPVEDGCINPHGCGGYMMVHKRQWEDACSNGCINPSAGPAPPPGWPG